MGTFPTERRGEDFVQTSISYITISVIIYKMNRAEITAAQLSHTHTHKANTRRRRHAGRHTWKHTWWLYVFAQLDGESGVLGLETWWWWLDELSEKVRDIMRVHLNSRLCRLRFTWEVREQSTVPLHKTEAQKSCSFCDLWHRIQEATASSVTRDTVIFLCERWH